MILESAALALWLGAALFFSRRRRSGVVRGAPDEDLRRRRGRQVLPSLLFAGLTIGALVAALELMASGRAFSRARFACGVVVAGACAIGQFVVVARIERLRASIGGPLESLAGDDPRRIEFGRLHGFSVAWLGCGHARVARCAGHLAELQPRS